MPADPRGDVEPGRAKPLGDHFGRSPLLTGDLGMPMKITAQRDQTPIQSGRRGVHCVLAQRLGRRAAASVRRPARRQPRSRERLPPEQAVHGEHVAFHGEAH
jgi:hypothetical protein